MRTILVTGHSKGIGKAITEKLLQQGHKVVGVSRNKLPDAANLFQLAADLNNINETHALAKSVSVTDFNLNGQALTIDAVVCNAGSGQFGALENFSQAQIETNINLNLISPLVLLSTLIPTLKKQARSDIIFIASESAVQGGRYGSVYSAAKFGLRGAAQSLRAECASANCHVGIINPGMVRTDFFSKLSFEPGEADQHALHASDVASAALTLLHSADNAVIEEINVSPLQHVVRKKPQ